MSNTGEEQNAPEEHVQPAAQSTIGRRRLKGPDEPIDRRSFAGALSAALLAVGCGASGREADEKPVVRDLPSVKSVNQGLSSTDAIVYAAPATGDPDVDTPELQALFLEVQLTRKIGIIPPGFYAIKEPLVLPTAGVVMGTCKRTHGDAGSVLYAAPGFDGDILHVQPNTHSLRVQDVGIRGRAPEEAALQASDQAAIRFMNATGIIQEVTFSNIQINSIAIGISCETIVGTPNPMRGCVFEFFEIKTYRHAIVLFRIVATRFYDVFSTHGDHPQRPLELRDIWLVGVPEGDGGLYMEEMVSNSPGSNGIVIENFTQVWAQHISGDGAVSRNIWIKNCTQIHLTQIFASLSGIPKSGITPVEANVVIENDAAPTDISQYKVNITLDQCHVGGTAATQSAALLLRNLRYVSITNGTFIENLTTAILVDNCENVTISSALIENRNPLDPGGTGVEIVNSRGCSVSSNQIRGFVSFGVRVRTGSSYVSIASNTIFARAPGGGQSANSSGIHVESSNYCSVVGNVIRGAGRLLAGAHRGIRIHASAFGTYTGNSVHEFRLGIEETSGSDYNVIASNATSYNGFGWSDSVVKLGGSTVAVNNMP